jgi:tetratricopeptide (TPR) repeat protein
LAVKDVMRMLSKKSLDNADAWTCYRIGESFLETGDPLKAEGFFQNANALAPLHPEFSNKYASILSLNNKNADARIILEKSIREYPKFPPALSNLGYLVLVMDGDTARSGILLDQALALDPDYEQAVINKAGLLAATAKQKEARLLLAQYLKRKPASPKVKAILDKLSNS